MTDLHIEHHGAGEPAVLVHGSGSWGVDTFPAQRELADEFHVLFMDRRGHGQSPRSAVIGWPTDSRDVVNLLAELGGAHLAGHSSGGTVALLAAGLRPDLVRSLVVIEPAVWGIADPGGPLPDYAVAQREVLARGPSMTAREFLEASFAAFPERGDRAVHPRAPGPGPAYRSGIRYLSPLGAQPADRRASRSQPSAPGHLAWHPAAAVSVSRGRPG